MGDVTSPTVDGADTRTGDALENPVTGERVRFLERAADTDGDYLRVELRVPPDAPGPVAHVKPRQVERFEVRSGTLTVTVDGEDRRLDRGERLTVPAGVAHTWRNDTDEPVTVIVEVSPALRTEEGVEMLFALGQDGRVNARGVPSPLQLAVMLAEYEDHTYLAGVPVPIQRAVAVALAPIGRALGYAARYPAHGER